MSFRPPRLSLRQSLLLAHLTVSLPPAALVSLGGDYHLGVLALAGAGALSALAAWLLARQMLAPIRAITAELRQGRPPHDVATAREEHTLVPTEIRELIAAFDTGRRPPGRQRRRATDRGGVADGTQAAPPVRRPPARLHDPALTDAVTGLANRRGLAEHLANVDGESPLDGTTAVHCIALTDLESV